MTKPQTIYDNQGNPVFAIIPWQIFQHVATLFSEISLSDEEIYDDAKRSEEESFPLEVANRLLAGESAVKVFRNYRGLTQKQVAQKVGIHPVYISQIETGKRTGSAKTLARIAEVLNIDIDDLI